jgi:DNA-binding response OmpR family regulator
LLQAAVNVFTTELTQNLNLLLDHKKFTVKLLLVEDEKDLSEAIVNFLSKEGYICERVSSVNDAKEKVALYSYDCILVDIGLPDGSGLDVVQDIKKLKSRSGVIIISAKNSVDDKISGLDLGADDYLAKPFNLAELNSRIRSVLRRRNFDGNNEIIVNEITIHPNDKAVKIKDSTLSLTKKEYDLLLFLVVNKNKVITKESIAEHLWGDEMDMADSFDFLYTHIKNLRKKLVDSGSRDYIKTVYGMGYRFNAE